MTLLDASSAGEFNQALAELVRAHDTRSGNERCIECASCERCTDCTFCQRGHRLWRCHYCVDVDSSQDCTHCRASSDLLRCNHCNDCRRCSQSAYLEHCVDCSECNYCFGCVGLTGREFHVLNQPCGRTEYFKVTARLKRELGAAALVGARAASGRPVQT